MKVSDQLPSVRNHFEVSNHVFVNQLLSGLQDKVGNTVPGLKILPSGKNMSQGQVSVVIGGEIVLENSEDRETAEEKVKQLMDSLKNPANLLSLLK